MSYLAFPRRNTRWNPRGMSATGAALALVLGAATLASPAAARPHEERRAYFGGEIGPVWLVGDSDDVRYETGLRTGGHLRMPVLPWLQVTPYVVWQTTPTNRLPKTTGFAGELESADATALTFALSLTTVWEVETRTRVWGGVAVEWAVQTLPNLRDKATGSVLFDERKGVFLAYPIELGAEFDLLPDWLVVGVVARWAPFTTVEESALYATQYGYTKVGQPISIDGLTEPRSLASVGLTVDMPL